MKTYTLPPELAEEFDALDDRTRGGTSYKWADEQDEVLRRYWQTKRQCDVVALFQKKWGWGSTETLKRRWRKLEQEGKV